MSKYVNPRNTSQTLQSTKTIPTGEQESKYLKNLLVELTRSKAKLEEYQIKAQAMIKSLGEGLIVADENGKITTVNPYALGCLGFEEQDLLGAWFPKVIVATDHQGIPTSTIDRPIIHALTTGQTVTASTYYQRRDKRLVPVHITVSPIMVNDQPIGAIEIFRDLTKEQQLDIAKDEFVSLASHQLRTPATGVKLILSMLEAEDFGPLTEKQHRYLQKAIQSNDRQLHIIEDLLNVARVDSGKMDLNLEYTNLAHIVRDIANEHLPIIQSRHQHLSIRAPQQLTAVVDSQKIRMVIDNLLSNASKYSRSEGAITVALEQTDESIVISIQDQGVGMSAEDIDKLFTKFTRLNNELSTTVGGTGLGLFLVKNLVELHNGEVCATSRQGIGSTFTVMLPLDQGAY